MILAPLESRLRELSNSRWHAPWFITRRKLWSIEVDAVNCQSCIADRMLISDLSAADFHPIGCTHPTCRMKKDFGDFGMDPIGSLNPTCRPPFLIMGFVGCVFLFAETIYKAKFLCFKASSSLLLFTFFLLCFS